MAPRVPPTNLYSDVLLLSGMDRPSYIRLVFSDPVNEMSFDITFMVIELIGFKYKVQENCLYMDFNQIGI